MNTTLPKRPLCDIINSNVLSSTESNCVYQAVFGEVLWCALYCVATGIGGGVFSQVQYILESDVRANMVCDLWDCGFSTDQMLELQLSAKFNYS